MKVRISYGTAVKMGLIKGKMLAEPTTAYIMLGEKCYSNCSFCAQRREARKEGYLSRVLWPQYDSSVLVHLKGFARVCFQTLDYPEVVENLLELLPAISLPVSVSIVPIPEEDMQLLKDYGVEILSIALDAATPEIFEKVKGRKVGNRFTWNGHWKALMKAKEIFGTANTHLIVGLGETDEELYAIMKKIYSLNISVALFAYTPIFGGNAPLVGRYRAIQLLRYLIFKGYENLSQFERGKLSSLYVPKQERAQVLRGIPFLTSGCPGCNRPFYNERPGGKIYNYPSLPVNGKGRLKELEEYVKVIWI